MTACRLQAAHYVIGPFEGLTHKAPGFAGGYLLADGKRLAGNVRHADGGPAAAHDKGVANT